MKKKILVCLLFFCFVVGFGVHKSQIEQKPSFTLFKPNIFTSPKCIYDLGIDRLLEIDQNVYEKGMGDTLVTFFVEIPEQLFLGQTWKFSIKKSNFESFLLSHNASLLGNALVCNGFVFHISTFEKDDMLDVSISYQAIPTDVLRKKLPIKHAFDETPYKISNAGKWEIFVDKAYINCLNIGILFRGLWHRCFHAIDRSPYLKVSSPNIFTSLDEIDLNHNEHNGMINIPNADTLITFTYRKEPYPQVISQKWTYKVDEHEYFSLTHKNEYSSEPIFYRNHDLGLNFVLTPEKLTTNEILITIEYFFPDSKYLKEKIPYL